MLRSPICTHLGCEVAWNTAEAHLGLPAPDRASANGDVLAGPAEVPCRRSINRTGQIGRNRLSLGRLSIA